MVLASSLSYFKLILLQLFVSPRSGEDLFFVHKELTSRCDDKNMFNQLRSEAQYLPCSSQNSLNKESTSPAKLGQPPRGGYSSDRIAAATAAAVYTQC